MELQVGNNVMRLFSLLYIAASPTLHVHYFSCVLLLMLVVIIYIYISPYL